MANAVFFFTTHLSKCFLMSMGHKNRIPTKIFFASRQDNHSRYSPLKIILFLRKWFIKSNTTFSVSCFFKCLQTAINSFRYSKRLELYLAIVLRKTLIFLIRKVFLPYSYRCKVFLCFLEK